MSYSHVDGRMWRSVRAQGLRLVLVGVFDFSRERCGRCTTSSLHPTRQHCVYSNTTFLLALVIKPPPRTPSDDHVSPSRLAKIIIPATHETQLPFRLQPREEPTTTATTRIQRTHPTTITPANRPTVSIHRLYIPIPDLAIVLQEVSSNSLRERTDSSAHSDKAWRLSHCSREVRRGGPRRNRQSRGLEREGRKSARSGRAESRLERV